MITGTTRIKHRCNDIERLRDAAREGYHYAELDVMQCSDGTLVCRHDHKHATDDNVWKVQDIPYTVDMGTTLDDMVREANDLKMGLFVELKDVNPSKPDRFEANVLDVIKMAEYPVVIISFSARVLTTMHMLDNTVPLVVSSLDGEFPLGDEVIKKMCRGVAIPQSKLSTSNAHSFPLFLFHIETPIPEKLMGGIAGVIE